LCLSGRRRGFVLGLSFEGSPTWLSLPGCISGFVGFPLLVFGEVLLWVGVIVFQSVDFVVGL
jgi:hypothetical protein